jgi:hypothetical protein
MRSGQRRLRENEIYWKRPHLELGELGWLYSELGGSSIGVGPVVGEILRPKRLGTLVDHVT